MSTHSSWRALGALAPTSLVEARLQLHFAAQVVPAFADALLAAEPDDSHSTMSWHPMVGVLAGHPVGNDSVCHVGVRLSDRVLVVLDEGGAIAAERSLNGQTLSGALSWAAGEVAAIIGREVSPRFRDYEMPNHPLGSDGAFAPRDSAACSELASWFGNAAAVLSRIQSNTQGASAVACWPHHFDIATLITLETNENASEARSIGVGFSPGDGSFPEPYWYVGAWPRPRDDQTLPALPHGGLWAPFGAVLRGTHVVAAADGPTQSKRVQAFLEEAIWASRSLLSA